MLIMLNSINSREASELSGKRKAILQSGWFQIYNREFLIERKVELNFVYIMSDENINTCLQASEKNKYELFVFKNN